MPAMSLLIGRGCFFMLFINSSSYSFASRLVWNPCFDFCFQVFPSLYDTIICHDPFFCRNVVLVFMVCAFHRTPNNLNSLTINITSAQAKPIINIAIKNLGVGPACIDIVLLLAGMVKKFTRVYVKKDKTITPIKYPIVLITMLFMPFIFNLVYIFTAGQIVMACMVTFVLVCSYVCFVVVSCVEYTALFAGFQTFNYKALTTNGQVR